MVINARPFPIKIAFYNPQNSVLVWYFPIQLQQNQLNFCDLLENYCNEHSHQIFAITSTSVGKIALKKNLRKIKKN